MIWTLLEDNDNPVPSTPKKHKKKEKVEGAKNGDNPGVGKKFIFHGAFSNKKDAEAKEKGIPGSFIKPVKIRGQRRYAVVEKKE